MTARKSPDWIVLTDNGSGALCTRCGATVNWSMPIECTLFSDLAKAFARAHASCTDDPCGTVCEHCHKRGHDGDPARCPMLNETRTAEQWIRSSDTGLSSLTIYAALTGNEAVLGSWGPHTPGGPE